MVVRFELQLLSEIGFGLDLERCVATGVSGDLVYVSPKSGRAVSRLAGEPWADKMLRLPAFLRDREIETNRAGSCRWICADGIFPDPLCAGAARSRAGRRACAFHSRAQSRLAKRCVVLVAREGRPGTLSATLVAATVTSDGSDSNAGQSTSRRDATRSPKGHNAKPGDRHKRRPEPGWIRRSLWRCRPALRPSWHRRNSLLTLPQEWQAWRQS